ncbi:MAG: bifunctional diguanylate cyclase/phosphohydrolase [Ktedonobacteraceae bacterium]
MMEKDGIHIPGQSGQLLPRPIRFRVVIALLFSIALFAWLLIKPASHDIVVSVDNLAQACSLLVAILLCFNDLLLPRRFRPAQPAQPAQPPTSPVVTNAAQRWIPRLFGLTILSVVLGQIVSLYYTQILQVDVPSPSLADVCNLSAYMFMILCLLLLPNGPLVKATRLRILLDSLMMILSVITYSWYFLLGPILLQANETILARIVQVAYPFADLLLILCVLLLLSHTFRPSLRPAVLIFSLALVLLAITDSISNFQMLHGTYVVGELLDAGWPLSFLLFGVAVKSVRLAQIWQPAAGGVGTDKSSSSPISKATPTLLRSFLPYFLPPISLLLIIYVWHTNSNGPLVLGVYLGGIGLIGLVLLRQLIAIKETIDVAQRTKFLNDELHIMQEELKDKNQALSEANVRLASLATTDPLTGLPNHRSLFQGLEKELDRARRHGRPLSLIFFDGDRFKRVNDTYGHAVGDAVLCELGDRVKSVLRGGDTPGRYGGEEFLILLPETDTEEARQIAERIRAAVAAHPLALSHVEGGVNMTVSIGVATYPLDGNTSGELVQKADQAMYWAKRLGRNQVRTCAEAFRASHDESLSATVHLLERHEGPLLDGMTGDQEHRAAQLAAVYSLMWLIELRDHGISTHSYNVSDLATAIAMEMGLEAQQIFDVSTAALLHDIGKIAIPDALLQKTSPLSANEWTLVKQHAEMGAQILDVSPALRHLMPAIHYHHERWDGTGYPDCLAGEAIPLESRIISVAEAYDTMLNPRSFKAARSASVALAELQRCAGGQFDPSVVQATLAVCLRLPAEFEQQEIAESAI